MIEIELSSTDASTSRVTLPAVIDYDDFDVVGVEFLMGDTASRSIDWKRTAKEARISVSFDARAGAAYVQTGRGRSRYQLPTELETAIDARGVIRSIFVDENALPRPT